MKTFTEKANRQRKLCLALPVLVLPFLTMLFWALDGGKGVYANKIENSIGLNTQLPSAQLKDNPNLWDKFSLYQQAQRDSLRKAEAERTDPYFRLRTITEIEKSDSLGLINFSLGEKKHQLDSNEIEIDKKILAINKVINPKKFTKEAGLTKSTTQVIPHANPETSEEVDRLEEMMLMMQSEGPADPEMAQIENVLEKILDVQHPERVREKIQEQSRENSGKVYPVKPVHTRTPVKYFGNPSGKLDSSSLPTETPNNFIRLDGQITDPEQGNAIQAIIPTTQTLSPGSTIKLRLVDDIYINGKLIQANAFLFGACQIQQDRLIIKISNIVAGSSLLPVSLNAYDLDGIEGLYVPGTITNDASKQVTNQALQDLQMMSVDPSIGAQAASAGIQTAKSLIGKRTKVMKVNVKAGYRLFLRDQNSNSK
jgi:conjugative transposon TraM protein